jgi:hypothetical protein
MKPLITAGLKYFLYFCLLYGVLTAISLIPSIGHVCNKLYQKPTAFILKSVFSKAYLQLSGEKDNADVIKVEYASKEKVQAQWRSTRQGINSKPVEVTGKLYEFRFYNTFLSFYLFFVALMLLSPLPPKEMLIGIIIGSVLYYLFSVFRVGMALLFFFNEPAVDIYHCSDFWVGVLKSINNGLTLGINVLVVIVLWAGLAFRKGNWRKLFPNYTDSSS